MRDTVIQPATGQLTLSGLHAFVDYLQNLSVVIKTLDTCSCLAYTDPNVPGIFEDDFRETKVGVGSIKRTRSRTCGASGTRTSLSEIGASGMRQDLMGSVTLSTYMPALGLLFA